jgi:predicted transcriptional regulator
MTFSHPNLRLLDDARVSREINLATEIFHRINRIIPEKQQLLTVPPSCMVREAVAQMRKHGYSQVPVVDQGQVLGVFSHRSFARETALMSLADITKQKCAPGDLRVDEFLEGFQFKRVTEEMTSVFDAMDSDNGVLIGTEHDLQGVLTPMDFLRYLHQVASPFVLVSEIELGLRALLRITLTAEEIVVAAKECLQSLYKGREDKIPQSLEYMTFDNYRSIITHRATWPKFEELLGGTSNRVGGKLQEIGSLRNDVFHFKREITMEDHEKLASHRNWLLGKVKQAESTRRKEQQQ